MNGVSASSFSPAEPMTRGMLAVVLHNLEGNPGASYNGSFGDVGGNDWYAQAVQWAADNSIVTGVSDGVFAPNASITREQLVGDRSIAPIPLAFAVRFNCAAGRGPGVKSRR